MARPSSFTAEADFRDGSAEVIVHGDVDATTTDALAEMLSFALSKSPRRLTLDLSAVGFLDCAAARVIAEAAQALPAGQFVIRDPSLPACRVLQLTGLAVLLEAGPWRADAYPDQEEVVWCQVMSRPGRRCCSGSTTSPLP